MPQESVKLADGHQIRLPLLPAGCHIAVTSVSANVEPTRAMTPNSNKYEPSQAVMARTRQSHRICGTSSTSQRRLRVRSLQGPPTVNPLDARPCADVPVNRSRRQAYCAPYRVWRLYAGGQTGP